MPNQVRWFENLFLLSFCLGVVIGSLNWDYYLDLATPGYVLFVQVFALLFSLILIFSISRLRSNIARWVLVISFCSASG